MLPEAVVMVLHPPGVCLFASEGVVCVVLNWVVLGGEGGWGGGQKEKVIVYLAH